MFILTFFCNLGKYSTGNAPKCGECDAGHYGLGGSTSKECDGKCPAGAYSLAGEGITTKCSKCDVGRYGIGGSKSTLCDGACSAGRYGLGGSTTRNCTGACPAGYFSVEGGLGPHFVLSRNGDTSCPIGSAIVNNESKCIITSKHLNLEFDKSIDTFFLY